MVPIVESHMMRGLSLVMLSMVQYLRCLFTSDANLGQNMSNFPVCTTDFLACGFYSSEWLMVYLRCKICSQKFWAWEHMLCRYILFVSDALVYGAWAALVHLLACGACGKENPDEYHWCCYCRSPTANCSVSLLLESETVSSLCSRLLSWGM